MMIFLTTVYYNYINVIYSQFFTSLSHTFHCDLTTTMPFPFDIDTGGHILNIYIAGCVLSYISVVFNIVLFLVLFRKQLLSPSTILMQGLAVADCFTSFCSYGLEPIFQHHYIPFGDRYRELYYPYCSLYCNVNLLVDTFHLTSVFLTSCLGMQKVIVILFSVWSMNYLTIKKCIVCCVLRFIIPMAITLQRHFTLEYDYFMPGYWGQWRGYEVTPKSFNLLKNSSLYYLIIQAVILTSCCVIMTTCTIYIFYKIKTNKFKGRVTERRKQEKRSLIMFVVVF